MRHLSYPLSLLFVLWVSIHSIKHKARGFLGSTTFPYAPLRCVEEDETMFVQTFVDPLMCLRSEETDAVDGYPHGPTESAPSQVFERGPEENFGVYRKNMKNIVFFCKCNALALFINTVDSPSHS